MGKLMKSAPAARKLTTVFVSGNSQAVRLPKDFKVAESHLEILRNGDDIVLRRVPRYLDEAFRLLAGLSEDFMADGRNDPPPEQRQWGDKLLTEGQTVKAQRTPRRRKRA